MNANISTFFKVIKQSRTYMNILYLLLSFPLGTFYFVFLITGLSLWLGFSITLFGIPILFATILLLREFAKLERHLTKIMLGVDIASDAKQVPEGTWYKVKFYLTDSFSWRALAYLFIKFPFGIISFVFLATLLSLSLGLIATPIFYHLTEIEIIQSTIFNINCYFVQVIFPIIGVFLLFISFHTLNGLSHIFGLFAKHMLEKRIKL
ncbi:MAG: sensor domain-containing protein [Sphingobacteriaceae bacterium]|jgi:hypothetical protein